MPVKGYCWNSNRQLQENIYQNSEIYILNNTRKKYLYIIFILKKSIDIFRQIRLTWYIEQFVKFRSIKEVHLIAGNRAHIMCYYTSGGKREYYDKDTFYWVRSTHVTLTTVSSDYIFYNLMESTRGTWPHSAPVAQLTPRSFSIVAQGFESENDHQIWINTSTNREAVDRDKSARWNAGSPVREGWTNGEKRAVPRTCEDVTRTVKLS